MSALERRVMKLEQVHTGVKDRLFVFIVPLASEPNGLIGHEPIGLSPMSRSGPFFPRLPGESTEDMQARAVRERPDVPAWVSRYEEAENQTPGVSQSKAVPNPVSLSGSCFGTASPPNEVHPRTQFTPHDKGML